LSSYAVTLTAPRRFESFCPSSPRMIGTWANAGSGTPSALKMLICQGVLLTCSSPRKTWLMRMSQSSTTTAKL
jgi:hypothetical protein